MKNKKVKSKHLGGNWYSGECGDYTFQAKAFVEPSDYGIDCGKVSKLHIQKDDEWRVNYDRGWEIIPRPEDYEAYDAIMDSQYRKVMYKNLEKLGKNYVWLKKQTEKVGIKPEDALIVTIDGNNQFFCQAKEKGDNS